VFSIVSTCAVGYNLDHKKGEAMTTIELITSKIDQIKKLTESYGARDLRIFGSVARKEDGPDSDIDLLVNLEKDRNLLDLIALEQDLSDLLGRKVDLLTEDGISKHIRKQIIAEARYL
jgi:hypothetical protein